MNSGEPLKTMREAAAAFAVFGSTGFIFEIMCMQEQQRAVVDARQPGTEAPSEALRLVLVLDFLLDLLPLDAERRVGEHVVELLPRVPVLRERVAAHDVLGVLALDHHVALADGVGFGVQLLPEDLQLGIGVQLAQVLLGDGKHAARSRSGIVERAYDALFASASRRPR